MDIPQQPPDLPLEAELAAFDRLKHRLVALWREVFPTEEEGYTTVVVPSVSVEGAAELQGPGSIYFEETLLFLLMRLRNPRARVVYVTSMPLAPAVVDYYLHFLAGIPASHAAARLTLLSVHDPSPRPLSAKILERPRLLARIRDAVHDRTRAYLTVFRSTALERRLAVLLDVPLNAADPGMDALCRQSGARRAVREAGVPLPEGREDLKSEEDAVEALLELKRTRKNLQRALIKQETSYWDEGLAVVALPEAPTRESVRAALHQLEVVAFPDRPEAYLERFAHTGGVVEELVEAPHCLSASVQARVNPLGEVFLTSTHDELLGGPSCLSGQGCRFPASDAYRLRIQEAGLKIAHVFARQGLVSRLSTEFVLWREDAAADWKLAATGVNLGVGGSTHPLLAVRFLTGGHLDAESGLFRSLSGRTKYYRASDHLQSPAYRGLVPEDVIEILTLHRLNYSHHGEKGALFYMLGAVSMLGRLGMVAIGNTPEEAEQVYQDTVAALDRACGVAHHPPGH